MKDCPHKGVCACLCNTDLDDEYQQQPGVVNKLGLSIPQYDNFDVTVQPSEKRDTEVTNYSLSKLRWLILLEFALVLISSAYMMMTFSAISLTTAQAYSVSDILVNCCVLVFLIAFVVFNFISIQIIEKLGLSLTVSQILLTTI